MRFRGCIIRGWTGSCASSRALATRSVLAAGRGGADGDSEDEENRGDGLHRVAVVWPAV